MKESKHSFWNNYEFADYFERKELIESLPLIKMILKCRNYKDVDDESFKYMIENVFRDYFDDIIEHMNYNESVRNGEVKYEE